MTGGENNKGKLNKEPATLSRIKMAALKFKDIERLSKAEKEEKLKELRFELIKNKATAKTKANIKEIKRAIAKILTFNRLNKDKDSKNL